MRHGALRGRPWPTVAASRPRPGQLCRESPSLVSALTHLLEVIVNLTHELVPQAVIVFNTGPATTTDAVGRWCPERIPLVDASGGVV